MKTAIIILFIATSAYAFTRPLGRQSTGSGIGRSFSAGTGTGAQPLTPTNPRQRFGQGFYGPGLNNPYAFPVNPFHIQSAKALLQRINAGGRGNALARVNVDGEIDFTDRFGREVELVDLYGNDLADLYNL